MDRKRLCVEVAGARNLESSQSVDAYCVVGLCDVKVKKHRSSSPSWAHVAEFVMPVRPASVRLVVQLYCEKNFFFDMFPSTSSNVSDEEEEVKVINEAALTTKKENNLLVTKPRKDFVNGWKGVHDSDSDDVVTLSEEEDEDVDEINDEENVWPLMEEEAAGAVGNCDDEMLGVVELNLSLLCKPSRPVTDSWYSLGGTRTGEVRIRTIWYERGVRPFTAQDRDMLFDRTFESFDSETHE
ncbi:unnamed protein product [Peronospora destructor]|uniref:C2 domain-containing protein n=1 Tax=Peronospora destructor TaxID=86335 RepID=A0AAV0UKS8_9STRA|nr:unnamed protein product [Peronospora destructor]